VNEKGKKICIITHSHLCRNPRVLKEAICLSKAGYCVTILNGTYSEELTEQDQSLIKDTGITMLPVFSLQKSGPRSYVYRLVKRLSGILVKKFDFQLPSSLGYASWHFLSLALRQKADLYICHQEIGLYCGTQLIKGKKKVAFDFEDWYSEDLLGYAQKERPIRLLRKLEKIALQQGAFCFTPSDAMSSRLALVYKARIPLTISNSFDLDETILVNNKKFNSPIKLFWFSQTIGPGRGLENFLSMLNNIEFGLEVHLLGEISADYKKELRNLMRGQHNIQFHPLVKPGELAAKIAEFDIGLALEQKELPSRDVTVTNKFFQYALSGLPIIISPSAGQVKISGDQPPGFLLDDSLSTDQAARLESWLRSEVDLQKARARAITFARQYCWQKESDKLLKAVNQYDKM